MVSEQRLMTIEQSSEAYAQELARQERLKDKDLTPCFAAMCQCGGWVGVTVDVPEHARDNAKEVARWMRAGFRIDKITVQSVRDGSSRMCECNREKKKTAKQ
jgi:hypothetical protein